MDHLSRSSGHHLEKHCSVFVSCGVYIRNLGKRSSMSSAASGLGTLCQHCYRPLPLLHGPRADGPQRHRLHFQSSCLGQLGQHSRSRRHVCRSTSPEDESKSSADDSMQRTVSALEALLGIEEEKPKQEQPAASPESKEASKLGTQQNLRLSLQSG